MPQLSERLLAWAVHVFTASGLLAAFMALISIDQMDWRAGFLWLFVALVVDGIDGTFARLFRVKEVLPHIDGGRIDHVIDFTTYALIPAYFFYKAEMTHDYLMLFAIAIMLLSSGLYYGKSKMVDEDYHFIGFPVLWNLATFFQFFIFMNQPMLNFISVVVLGLLHFIPLKFAYPSRAKSFFGMHLTVTALSLLAGLSILIYYPQPVPIAKYIVVGGGIYFMLFALFDTFKS